MQRVSPLARVKLAVQRLKRKKQMLTEKDRKADTRMKINLGGLIMKADMHSLNRAVLLGALLDAKHRMATPSEAQRLQSIGDAAFADDKKPVT